MQRRGSVLGVVVVLSMLVSACGGGQESDQPAGASESAGAPAQAASPAAAPNRCPLTAEQVSAAVGAEVTGPNSACMFAPGDDLTVRPNVTFVRQVPFACSGTIPAEAGFEEEVPGLGVTAHIVDGPVGTRLLVCQGQTPFEIEVDAETPQLRRDAAIALARQVLSGS